MKAEGGVSQERGKLLIWFFLCTYSFWNDVETKNKYSKVYPQFLLLSPPGSLFFSPLHTLDISIIKVLQTGDVTSSAAAQATSLVREQSQPAEAAFPSLVSAADS